MNASEKSNKNSFLGFFSSDKNIFGITTLLADYSVSRLLPTMERFRQHIYKQL